MAILLSLMWSSKVTAAISHDTGSLPPYNSQSAELSDNLHATLELFRELFWLAFKLCDTTF